tara:strand:+ start:269 stop:538 length:270 start_codon:yes stop_codon:yes gene_type:complete
MEKSVKSLVDNELKRIKSIVDTKDRLSQMENLVLKLTKHVSDTEKRTENVLLKSTQEGGKRSHKKSHKRSHKRSHKKSHKRSHKRSHKK